MNQAVTESRVLEAEVARLEKRRRTEAAFLRELTEGVVQRRERLPAILRTLAASIDDEVLFDGLSEADDQGGFQVRGWSATDTAVRRFINKLARGLSDGGHPYRVEDEQVSAGRGRLGIDGYNFSLWLIPQGGERA